MGVHWQDGGYSADVDIYLIVDGRRIEVAQIGPDSLILSSDCDVPAGHAQVVIVIDGRKRVQDVILCRESNSGQNAREMAYA